MRGIKISRSGSAGISDGAKPDDRLIEQLKLQHEQQLVSEAEARVEELRKEIEEASAEYK